MTSPVSRDLRLAMFASRFMQLPNAKTGQEVRSQLEQELNKVEDELSGVPYDPSSWENDGRMYPPQDDRAFPVPDHPEVTMYRTKGHRIYIRTNGSIRAVDVRTGAIFFAKLGQDGKGVFDA